MGELFSQIMQVLGYFIPRFLAAIILLVVGYLCARFVAAMLKRAQMHERLTNWVKQEKEKPEFDTDLWISKAVFLLIMLFVLVGFFEILGLTLVTQPLNRLLDQIFAYAPRLIGPVIFLLIAWFFATVLRFLVINGLSRVKFDEKLSEQTGIEKEKQIPLSKTIGDAVYWRVFLLFLPMILEALALEGILEPVKEMIARILEFLPNIFAALVIFGIGWVFARIVQRVTSSTLAAIGIDRFSESSGIAPIIGKRKLSNALGLIVYILIIIPVVIAALNTLELDAITQPASNMLNMILAATPMIFAALLLLIFSVILGKWVSELVSGLLENIGFDGIMVKLGFEEVKTQDQLTPSKVIGYLVYISIILFALIEAFEMLQFEQFATLLSRFTVFAGHVLLGVGIFGVGLFLANIAAKALTKSNINQAVLLAGITRIAIIVLAAVMGLGQMGIASDILNLAFGLFLGAIAVAAAIAFGIGGRDIAKRLLEDIVNSMKSKQ